MKLHKRILFAMRGGQVMPNEADKELFDLLEAYMEAIKSLHHTIEYQKLNLTPDEILDKEDVETEQAKVQLLAWRDRAVRAELEATYKAELRQAVEKVYEADND